MKQSKLYTEAESFVNWCLANGFKDVVKEEIERRNALFFKSSVFSQKKFFVSNKREYYRKEYLKSSHWSQLKSAKLLKSPECEDCGSSYHLDVHHLCYKNLYDVLLSDLKTLCRDCHGNEHAILEILHKDIWETRLKLIATLLHSSSSHVEDILARCGLTLKNYFYLLQENAISFAMFTYVFNPAYERIFYKRIKLAHLIMLGKQEWHLIESSKFTETFRKYRLQRTYKIKHNMNSNEEAKHRIKLAAISLNIDILELEKVLTKLGINQEGLEDLKDETIFRFSDFRENLQDKPIVWIRKAFRVLRVGEEKAKHYTSDRVLTLANLGHKQKLEDADTTDLLKLYLPDKLNDPVTLILTKRFGDQKVIAFKADGQVAVAETAGYLADLEQGVNFGLVYVDGELTELYPVGVSPNVELDEDPFYPGRPLSKVDHRSTVNHRSWSNITLNVRQYCRLMLQLKLIDVNNRSTVVQTMQLAIEKGINGLKEIYPEAMVEFRKLEKIGQLPRLKLQTSDLNRSNNPFIGNRKF